MAADAYLKAAAAQLQSAVQAIKQQISELRSHQMATENQLKQQINHNEAEMRALAGRMALPNEDISHVTLGAQMQRIKIDTDQKKRELQEIQSTTQQAIRAKESAMNDITSEAHSLENKAGNPTLR